MNAAKETIESNYYKLMQIKNKANMKQYQLQQEKFPKVQHQPAQTQISSQQIKAQANNNSQMIRIIIALLIAIFIYNESQQTTINYNEIIKNQKMFLVKNIRGVLPTLSGKVDQLQGKWQIVHFQNFHQNDSEMFNSLVFNFNQTRLIIEGELCNLKLEYDWKNYSYNIDLKRTSQQIQVNQLNAVNSFPQANDAKQKAADVITQISLDKKQNIHPSEQITSPSKGQKVIDTNFQHQDKNVAFNNLMVLQQKQRRVKCEKDNQYFTKTIQFTSVWTISGKNLYLLLENSHLDEDFYFVLQRYIV